jgi:Fibronectin type III domain
MRMPHPARCQPGTPSTSLRANTATRKAFLAGCLIASLFVSLLPLRGSHASGTFWLPTQQASDPSFDHLNPVMAAYRNHAYILSVRVNGSSPVTSVFFSTNESGHWATQLLTDQGPNNTYSDAFTTLTVDPSTGRLYAAWIYTKNANAEAIGVWTRDPLGQWSGPTDAVVTPSLSGAASIVAQNGKAYIAFSSPDFPGACDDSASRSGDVHVVSYDGGTWSTPQNLTSCVSLAGSGISVFDTPKLAIDEAGHPYLVSFVNGDLWYADAPNGAWGEPSQITHGANIAQSVGSALHTFYGIAASNGTVYVVYTRQDGTSASDVLLTTRTAGGSWSTSARISPQDPHNCPKFGLSIVANAGRVGVSYAKGHTGYCKTQSGVFGNVPFVFTGSPGGMTSVRSLTGVNPDCFYTSLTNEGNLFRFVAACDHATSIGKGQLYYKAEFLDTVGPIAHLHAPGRASSSIQLNWSARDPQPGSGVALYQLKYRVDSGAWKTLFGSTTARTYTYRGAQHGHRYTFRLRAKDRVDNWGAWVSASTQVG